MIIACIILEIIFAIAIVVFVVCHIKYEISKVVNKKKYVK